MFMVLSSRQSHCESSPNSFDECRTAPSDRRPKTKPDDLGCESACTGCQSLHPPLPFIIITQPESWYSFYRRAQGRRLSRLSWLVTYRDGLPVHRRSPILVLTGSDVAQLRLIEANALLTQTANFRYGRVTLQCMMFLCKNRSFTDTFFAYTVAQFLRPVGRCARQHIDSGRNCRRKRCHRCRKSCCLLHLRQTDGMQ